MALRLAVAERSECQPDLKVRNAPPTSSAMPSESCALRTETLADEGENAAAVAAGCPESYFGMLTLRP
jgi:hypothetical protein